MGIDHLRSILVGSAREPFATSIFVAIVTSIGSLVILNLLAIVYNIPPELGVISIPLAAVLASYRYGLVPIWIALYPFLVVVLGLGCSGDVVGCEPFSAALFASLAYGTFGFAFGVVFAWKRQTTSRGKTFSAIGKGALAGGLTLYVIGMIMPKNGSHSIGTVTLHLDFLQELLVLGSKGAIAVGILSFVVGKSLSWNIDEREATS